MTNDVGGSNSPKTHRKVAILARIFFVSTVCMAGAIYYLATVPDGSISKEPSELNRVFHPRGFSIIRPSAWESWVIVGDDAIRPAIKLWCNDTRRAGRKAILLFVTVSEISVDERSSSAELGTVTGNRGRRWSVDQQFEVDSHQVKRAVFYLKTRINEKTVTVTYKSFLSGNEEVPDWVWKYVETIVIWDGSGDWPEPSIKIGQEKGGESTFSR